MATSQSKFFMAFLMLVIILSRICVTETSAVNDFGAIATVVGSTQLYLNLQCPASLPMPCRGVTSTNPRVVQTLWDGRQVLCDAQTEGGGWLIVQRRMDGRLDFYRNWEDYKHGFGNITTEFWFGNEKVHQLTNQRRFEMRVDFKFNGNDYFATYSHFHLYSEAENYKLDISGYTGNAGDAMGYHNNMQFSTKDRDNDLRPSDSAAELFHGAWWYKTGHHSNLNGLWGSKTEAVGVIWKPVTGLEASASFTEMKIRPVA